MDKLKPPVAAAEGCVRVRSARIDTTPYIPENRTYRFTTASRPDAGLASSYKVEV